MAVQGGHGAQASGCTAPLDWINHLKRAESDATGVGGMGHWWHQDIVEPGELPMLLALSAFVLTFAVTRRSRG
ncbi:hypothetical protein Sfulv_14640 [Streptomyces fulvorobeus]|uniref:Uncharacterized protein n=2 Tax=Streptomyces fulvorobeus TaxID=284028 RepID=A0A7J0C403_9ACTN|nr:hypothetical protein Sfulv_14640 [Streptomyces fulvorobeus]